MSDYLIEYRNNWVEFYLKKKLSFVGIFYQHGDNDHPYKSLLHFQLSLLIPILGFSIFGVSLVSLFFVPFLFVCWGEVYIKLPIVHDSDLDGHDDPQSYGFYIYSDDDRIPESFWIRWGNARCICSFPWTLTHIVTKHKVKNGEMISDRDPSIANTYRSDENWKDLFWHESYPVEVLHKRSPEITRTLATISVTSREWRQRWLTWTPLFAFKRNVIEIQFLDPVGREKDSWKGGTVGCSYEMLPGENPKETLDRMCKEREF